MWRGRVDAGGAGNGGEGLMKVEQGMEGKGEGVGGRRERWGTRVRKRRKTISEKNKHRQVVIKSDRNNNCKNEWQLQW